MSRAEARRRFTVADHRAATSGVECRKDEAVIDETPAAYKDIDAVMAGAGRAGRDRPYAPSKLLA
jgi:tRNA-splicing ligase RtcB